MSLLIIIAIWLGCGFVDYGLMLGYLTHLAPEQANVGFSVAAACGGPLSIPAVLALTAPYHWRIKPLTTEQRWEEFDRQWPTLGRAYFEQNYN